MKRAILAFIAIIISTAAIAAKPDQTVTLRVGDQKAVKHTKLLIRFDEVVEDSRCPMNARCVWAGNAKVRISVAMGRRVPESFELNSTLEPQSIDFHGYRITYEHLTEKPTQPGRGTAVRPQLRLSVRKIK